MPSPSAKTAARVPLKAGLIVAVLIATQLQGAAFGQDANAESGPTQLTTQPLGMTGWRRDAVTVTTDALGMSGWWPEPVIAIRTSTMGMTGWRRAPVTITTSALGMTGWRPDAITTTTEPLGMTGWQRAPIAITTPAFAMTGWGSPPELCTAPFLRDSAGEECVCPEGLLPAGNTCIAAGASPPSDLRVENQGPNACEGGKTCPFDILVDNVGAGPFRGPLVVRSAIYPSGVRLSTSSSGWSCAVGACVNPDVTLAPGGSERLRVELLVPTDAPDSKLRHCAELDAPEPGDAPVRFVQLMLNAAGIDAGPADNQMGGKTRRAIEAFRVSVGLPGGSDIDEPLLAALRSLIPADPQPENDRDCTETRVSG